MTIFGPLPHSWKKNEFSQKNWSFSFYILQLSNHHAEIKNTNDQTAKKKTLKLTDRQSDKQSDRQTEMQTKTERERQTDNQYFKGPSVLSGSKKFHLKIIDRILNRPLNCG